MSNRHSFFPALLITASLLFGEGGSDALSSKISQDDAKKAFIFRHLDIPQDSPQKEMMMAKVFSNFGLMAHEKNFLIPLSYTTQDYEKRDPIMYPDYDQFNNNFEAEFQISLKKDLSYDLFGLNEIISFGYTQEVWWQVYSDSAPFRETNYRPEVWLTLPIKDKKLYELGFKAFKFGFWHESNGMGEPLSREWNQIYMDTVFYKNNLFATLRIWVADAGENNRDITSYLGHGEIKLNYFLHKHQLDLTVRNNLHLQGNKGSFKLEWSYPIADSDNNFWYLRAFSGYGASLVDYDKHQNRIGFGFLFSR